MDILPPDLVTYSNDAKTLLEDLQSRNERMFLLTFLVVNMAQTRRELDNDLFTVSGIVQKYNCTLKRLDFQQEDGFLSDVYKRQVKHSVENPPEKQVIFENHHEPIIDTQTWERVQELRKQRKRPNRYDEVGLFSGILFCADCGSVMYQQRYQTCLLYTSRCV